jgi:hypothetical protein
MGPQVHPGKPDNLDKSGLRSLPLLLLDTRGGGEGGPQTKRQFFFEKQWCKEEAFLDLVKQKWELTKGKSPREAYSLDIWHATITELRRWLKGWGQPKR